MSIMLADFASGRAVLSRGRRIVKRTLPPRAASEHDQIDVRQGRVDPARGEEIGVRRKKDVNARRGSRVRFDGPAGR